MSVGFDVCVLIVFCFGETLSYTSSQERFSRVRYLAAQSENDAQASRPFFHWKPLLSATPSATENSRFVVTFPFNDQNLSTSSKKIVDLNNKFNGRRRNKNGRKKVKRKRILNDYNSNAITTTGSLKEILKPPNEGKKRRHKQRRVRKRKLKRKRVKNESNVLEIPETARNLTAVSTWNLQTDSSIQDVISKLNNNPETSYENLLGKGVLEDEVKISRPKSQSGHIKLSSPSLPNPNDFSINSADYKNDTRILLESRERKSKNVSHRTAALGKSSYKTQFYDSLVNVLDTTVPTITESIFKKHFRESEDKIINTGNPWRSNYNEVKINYPELIKQSTGNVSLVNFSKDLDTVNNNLDVLQTNNIFGYLGKPFNGSGLESARKYRRFRCNVNNGGCAHFCRESYEPNCFCLEGFVLDVDGTSCIDINECSNNNGGCESLCYNIVGSYYCSCPAGLRLGDDLKSCEDINECLLRNGHGPCQDTCTNMFGSYFCGCSYLNGTRLSEDKHTCEDINECKEGKSGCSHGCINTHGRAFCTCPDGMELGTNWKTCYDINECENEELSKQCKYGCINTVGSYICLDLNNEQNDQIPVAPEHISCPPLFPPKHGFFHCSRKKAALGGYRTKEGRMRITNRPGTFCELVCPVGFKTVGGFRVTCGLDGRWVGEMKGKCSPSPKPKIKCPGPLTVELNPGEQIAHVTFPPPKASVNWKYVESEPVSGKELEAYLPQGHHWITFKAIDPYTQLNAKCIIYIIVKKPKTY